ncbi:hemerythrin domain-containing protein [Palleronia caenipelagi]|uniref:Hemerythrin domain-containing protein n=1 Tax=Palleronia caenipelagi TaxID=2489174 RepID=A0A547PR44_9RHOB|nr:hemerythrin domain-containing protein [Palleronia caenipelagi]TRD16610.1 hemerythrin domain-containing protein [Palleronia caenipelagi]
MSDNPEISLTHRAGLPDALRVLVDELPRGTWEAHPNFSPLTRFWLDRHLMFREVLGRLRQGAEALLQGDLDPQRFGRETSRYGGFLLQELHGHHGIEDHHYFPVLQALDGRLERGFDLLDADHHALDAQMAALAEAANGALTGLAGADPRTAVGQHLEVLGGFHRFLDRHLEDEEDLVVPLILRYAPEIG